MTSEVTMKSFFGFMLVFSLTSYSSIGLSQDEEASEIPQVERADDGTAKDQTMVDLTPAPSSRNVMHVIWIGFDIPEFDELSMKYSLNLGHFEPSFGIAIVTANDVSGFGFEVGSDYNFTNLLKIPQNQLSVVPYVGFYLGFGFSSASNTFDVDDGQSTTVNARARVIVASPVAGIKMLFNNRIGLNLGLGYLQPVSASTSVSDNINGGAEISADVTDIPGEFVFMPSLFFYF